MPVSECSIWNAQGSRSQPCECSHYLRPVGIISGVGRIFMRYRNRVPHQHCEGPVAGFTLVQLCSALSFIERLQHHSVKRSSRQEAPLHNINTVQWVSGIRSAMPVAAAILALEDHAGGSARRQQSVAGFVVRNRTDVRIGQPIVATLPGEPGIGTAKRAFPGRDKNDRREVA